jgi:D-psicose/D-tagatose/L-ribulose 3-epimerase
VRRDDDVVGGGVAMKIGLMASQLFEATEWEGAVGLRLARELGYGAVELQVEDPDPEGVERRTLVADVAAAEARVSTIACLGLGINDLRSHVRRFHVEQVKSHVELACAVGASRCMVCMGEYQWVGIIPEADQWDAAVASLRAVAEHASGRGVSIVLELEALDLAMVNSCDTMARFLDAVGDEAVSANVDVSHMGVRGLPAASLRQLAGRVGNVHFSDSDGRAHGHYVPGDGVMPLAAYVEELIDGGFDGVFSVEVEPLGDRSVAYDWAVRSYEATRRLLADAGARLDPA